MTTPVEAPDAETRSRELVRALQRQLMAGGEAAELIETHISWVLLAGDTAWKIKKPVSLGFLDFGSLARRRHFCEEELRLNRRYAPSVYREVLAITGTPEQPRFGGSGAPIEFALRMRRFPARALLSDLLADGRLQPAHIDALAQRLADSHAQAAVASADSPWALPEQVAEDTRAVLRRLQARAADVADLERWLEVQTPRLTPLWRQRREEGAVRECHGDLHLANAVLLDEGVTLFDAIEFDPALRWIDQQSDMAFMAMDLMARGRADLAWRFVNAWLEASGDHAGIGVLNFYWVHRALVRALVARIPAASSPSSAPGAKLAAGPSSEQYLSLARHLAFTVPRPRLLVTHGPSGSGKTHLTQRLLEFTGAVRLRSDVERKRLFGLSALAVSSRHVPGGIYGPVATQRTFDRIGALATQLLVAGYAVIVDAACLRRAEREQLAALAAELSLPFTLLDCQAGLQTLRQRVRARQQRGDDASEADESVLIRQLDCAEPLSPEERAVTIEVQTDGPVDVASVAKRWAAEPVRSSFS